MSRINFNIIGYSQEKEVAFGSTGLELLFSIDEKLVKKTYGLKLNGQVYDLLTGLKESGSLEFLVELDHPEECLDIVRHSTAHLMAMAIIELFPHTKLAIGPVIDQGFYYDLQSDHTFTPEDFYVIEKKMTEFSRSNFTLERKEVVLEDAISNYKKQGEIFKVDLLEGFDCQTITEYKQGDFSDLCRGPHVLNTGRLQHFKLLSVAGSYWRGDNDGPQLQRIYATAFLNKIDLKWHLKCLEEAKKRDHRVLGKSLELFHMDEKTPGMVFWHPRGWSLYQKLESYIDSKLKQNDYHFVKTPEIVSSSLFQQSGHLDKFGDMMFQTESENRQYVVKPMNCPCHVEIFKKGVKSFKDLPLRLAEFGKCHRNELSGTMHGLMRVRGFVQDDAHIFCTKEQIQSEVVEFCCLLKEIYKDFGFNDIVVKFSDRPEKRLGNDETWDQAEKSLKLACEQAELEYTLNLGEGAFYGPKLEFVLKDCLNRDWQCGTIQVDFQLPERLGSYYIDENSNKQYPVILHRAILGSLERFIGILIENYEGDFPLWLNSRQIRIVPVSDKFLPYCKQIQKEIQSSGILCEIDARNEKLGKKICLSEIEKIPYTIVIGEKEQQENLLSLRKRKVGNIGVFPIQEVINRILDEIQNKNSSI